MNRLAIRLLRFVTVALLLSPCVARAQEKQAYRPLHNQEMSQMGIWDEWIKTFSDMTPKQKAEVMRRHINLCLESFTLTDEQRAFVKDFRAKYLNEATYDPAPAKREALNREMQPMAEKGMTLLGNELFGYFFVAKPPLSVLQAVKNDAFK